MAEIAAIKPFSDADERVERDGLVRTRIVDEFRALRDRNELERVASRGEEDVHAADDLADHGFVEGFDVNDAFFAQPERREDVRLVHRAAAFVDAFFEVQIFVGERKDRQHLRAALAGRQRHDAYSHRDGVDFGVLDGGNRSDYVVFVDGRLLQLALLLGEIFVDRGLFGVQRLFFDHFATVRDNIFIAAE